MSFEGALKPRYLPRLDGLRAVAVIACIVGHFNKEILPSGYLGVDIFFVISGYVITSSITHRSDHGFWQFLSGFYIRRIKRLIPALLVFVIITSVLICFFNTDPRVHLRTGITSLFGLSNFYLIKQSTEYFAQSSELNPFLHTWSLAVEAQFYFVFPLIVWATGLGAKTEERLKRLFSVNLILGTLSVVYYLYLNSTNEFAGYYLMPSRYWEIAAGSLVYTTHLTKFEIYQCIPKIGSYCIFIVMIGILFMPVSFYPISNFLMIFCSMILISILSRRANVLNFLSSKYFVFIGTISYSLYLWHWSVLSISRLTIGIHWWSIPIQVLMILVLAICSYKLVEQPFRSKIWARSNSKTALKALVAIWLSAIGLVTIDIPLQGKLFLGSRAGDSLDVNSEFIPSTPKKCSENIPNRDCMIEPINSSTKKIFLFGDSHAASLIPLIGSIHHESGLGVYISNVGTYPYILESDNRGLTLSQSLKLLEKRERMFRLILKKLKSGDMIFLASRWDHWLFEDFFEREYAQRQRKHYSDEGEYISSEETLGLFISKLSDIVSMAHRRGINVIVLSPIPAFRGAIVPRSTYSCVKEWFRPYIPSECKIEDFNEEKTFILNRVQPIRKALRSLSSEHVNLFIYDVFDYLCKSDICTTYKNSVRMYKDDDHLSNQGALSLKENFLNFLSIRKLL